MKNLDLLDRLERCIKNVESVMESNNKEMQDIINKFNRDKQGIMDKLGNIIKDMKGEEEQPGEVEKRVSAAYYIDPALERKLKILGIKLDRNPSDLINQAISDLLEEHDVA